MEIARSSGVLLHPTSLPSAFGIGDLGPDAYRFVDFLADAGQGWWQILPLGPTGYGNSPYMTLSALAGNPLLVSPELLVRDDLLTAGEIADYPELPREQVDYPAVIAAKETLLRRAHERFRARSARHPAPEYYAFVERNAFWLEDYVLFRALKRWHDERVWTDWDAPAVRREPEALLRWRTELADELQYRTFLEYVFHRQWYALRAHAHERGVRIIGDIPIYVAHDSAEVWAHRDLFYLDQETGQPLAVAGVPPDYFSATGQRWGNPLYRWEVSRATGHRWWIERFRATYDLVDVARIDHFRGFEGYWEVPAADETALNGRWQPGPGAEFFETVEEALGPLPVIAEDLGVITPEVEALRDRFGFPGMRILQMAFGDDPMAGTYKPHQHVPHAVVYTATHDHNTTVGWFTAAAGTQSVQTAEEVERERQHALDYLRTDGREIHWDFVAAALRSVANLALFPLQDLLGLGSDSRMNLPGTGGGNWEWRFDWSALGADVGSQLAELTRLYDRSRHG